MPCIVGCSNETSLGESKIKQVILHICVCVALLDLKRVCIQMK